MVALFIDDLPGGGVVINGLFHGQINSLLGFDIGHAVGLQAMVGLEGEKRGSGTCAEEAIGLSGILEVEAIFHRGQWKVIDLNARLPMYTGEALLETGINLLGELVSLA